MERCFGRDEKIIDYGWEHLSKLRTIREPHEPMPRLKELLEYMATPGLEKTWLLLDIKVTAQTLAGARLRPLTHVQIDNDAEDVFRLVARTISEVPPPPHTPWDKRIILGCWAVGSPFPPRPDSTVSWTHPVPPSPRRRNSSLPAPNTSLPTPSPTSASPSPTPDSSCTCPTSPSTSSKPPSWARSAPASSATPKPSAVH